MNHQFEGFLSDIARYGDQRAANARAEEERQRHQRALKSRDEELDRLTDKMCEVYAEREAALAQLRRFDPENPLLHDIALRQRMGDLAKRVFYANPDPDGALNYERAREVGRTFVIPGR